MRRDTLMAMSGDELDAYAKLLGANTAGMDSHAEKIAAIDAKRESTHEVTLLGKTFSIPVRNIRDKRFQDVATSINNDIQAEKAARLALGEEQWDELVERASDEDGVIDIDALGYAVALILHNPELKNY